MGGLGAGLGEANYLGAGQFGASSDYLKWSAKTDRLHVAIASLYLRSYVWLPVDVLCIRWWITTVRGE